MLQAIILFVMYPLVSTTVEPLDVQVAIDPETIMGFFNQICSSGMAYYRLNQMTVDMLFPIIYSLTYSLLLIELMKSCAIINSGFKYVSLLPFAIALSDVVENINILVAINRYPEMSDLVYEVIFVSNLAKHFVSVLVLLAIVVLTLWLGALKIKSIQQDV